MKFFGAAKSSENDPVTQNRVDAMVAAARAQSAPVVKRPLFREAPRAALAPSTDLLERRLEEELLYVRRLLESMGDALCEDPILLSRHGEKLQTIDLLAQLLGHIASVIGAEDRDGAVSRIGMMELRNRLARGSGNVGDAAPTLYRAKSNPFSAV